MIKTFGDATTRRFAETGKNKFSGMDADAADNRLALIDSLDRIENFPRLAKYRLHMLSGNLSGLWSVDINGPWRLLFKFENGDAYQVTIADTH